MTTTKEIQRAITAVQSGKHIIAADREGERALSVLMRLAHAEAGKQADRDVLKKAHAEVTGEELDGKHFAENVEADDLSGLAEYHAEPITTAEEAVKEVPQSEVLRRRVEVVVLSKPKGRGRYARGYMAAQEDVREVLIGTVNGKW